MTSQEGTAYMTKLRDMPVWIQVCNLSLYVLKIMMKMMVIFTDIIIFKVITLSGSLNAYIVPQ